LAVIALIFWLASLALTGLVLYAEQRRLLGAEILVTGWLSPLLVNFAWFANPLFLWAVLQLHSGKSALRTTLVSAVLSLDVLRFTVYVLDAGGGSTLVYGYGWGVVLWFVALTTLIAAAGTRQMETRMGSKGASGIDEWLRPIGFALSLSVLAAAGWMAIQDRRNANQEERERLSGLAFKRKAVCEVEGPTVSQRVRLAGPLEISFLEGSNPNRLSPFDDVARLLEWGIPLVRVTGRDYSFVLAGEERLLTSVPASTASASTLFVSNSDVNGQHQFSAKLVEQATGRTVFDQVWKMEGASSRYCPAFSSHPEEDVQPRKVLTEALAVRAPLAQGRSQPGQKRQSSDNRVTAEIVEDSESVPTSPVDWRLPSESIEVLPVGKRRPWHGNKGCPDHIGWEGHASDSPVRTSTGWPFMVGDTAFYPERHDQYYAFCAGDYAYLYSGTALKGQYHLQLEKRRLPDFYREGSGTVVIWDTGLDERAKLNVASIEDGDAGLTIALTKENSRRRLVVKAPLRLSR
jgi:hypothetical protein